MEREILQQIQLDRAAKRPLVVATYTNKNIQKIIYPLENKQNNDLDNAAFWALNADRSELVEIDGDSIFLNVLNPPLRLIIVGAVHIAQPLCHMAVQAGFDVTVVDPRRAFASAARFPDITLLTDWPDEALEKLAPDRRTAVVTLTHDPKLDDPALLAAIGSDAFYIGSLGSRKTHAARLERLRRAGCGEESLKLIHGPVGLAIGAVSPAEIAVSILAEITRSLRLAPTLDTSEASA